MSARRRMVAADLSRGRDLHGAAFAGAAACGGCHPDHLASWRRTFHRTMTQDVSASTVVAGDFSGVTFRYGGVSARMHRDAGGRYVMTFFPDDGTRAPVDAVVVRAVGSRRYQQYLADVGGALWRLPLAFHIEDKRWFHMNGAFLTPDPEPPRPRLAGEPVTDGAAARVSPSPPPRFGGGDFDRHVTRWNDNCVFCHNVAPNPGRDPRSGVFRTTVAELGIACEACHGPGAEHGRANADPVRRYTLHGSGAADPTIINPSRLSPARAADLCGRCHGQRISDDVAPFLERGDPFVPGDDLALTTAPLWRNTPLRGDDGAFAARFWDDGTPRLTAYEYQGLLQSRCAQRGPLTCTTCHGMHDGDPRGQLRPSAVGDGACTTCHPAYAGPAAVARHTRHDPAGAGAACVGCHMPRIVYGVLAVHPSHRIEIPDPARAAAAGRPDACTLCHVDADRAWAVRERARLWPPAPGAGRDRGRAASEGRGAPREAVFAGDPIARAVAADALGGAPPTPHPGGPAAAVAARAQALLQVVAGDRYPAVRHLAARALARLLDAKYPEPAAAARAFSATAPESDRRRALDDLRAQWPFSDDTRPDPALVSRLRQASRLVDIDIGE
ncbi:MAG: hypothetical protein ABUS79_01085 [Pseudomonadota bacterium]